MQLDETLDLDRTPVPAWAWLLLAGAVVAAYLVALDNGVVLRGVAATAHELFHDTRHFIGVPCH